MVRRIAIAAIAAFVVSTVSHLSAQDVAMVFRAHSAPAAEFAKYIEPQNVEQRIYVHGQKQRVEYTGLPGGQNYLFDLPSEWQCVRCRWHRRSSTNGSHHRLCSRQDL